MAEISDEMKELLRSGMLAAEKGDYTTGYKALSEFYGSGEDGLPVDGLSYFGLCLGVVEKQTRKGAQLCEAAIKAQFYKPHHYVNLVKLYLEREDRRNAVRVLETGLRRMPDDQRLRKIRNEIGFRRRPVIPFLSRDNYLNYILGIITAKPKPPADK